MSRYKVVFTQDEVTYTLTAGPPQETVTIRLKQKYPTAEIISIEEIDATPFVSEHSASSKHTLFTTGITLIVIAALFPAIIFTQPSLYTLIPLLLVLLISGIFASIGSFILFAALISWIVRRS
jgi:hypothetical protein